ncbi:dNA primase [Clostridium sp. CAG:524]|nr:dNA primase [Clostridium sp. CAG:524]
MAFIDKSIIDEIKSKNDIVDVIGSYISLNDKNKALCPFHDDHSPSFSVQKDKQIYKCFSCGESGNVITFVQKYNGITFTEALKMLADRAGIPLNVSTTRKINTKYEKLYEINDTVNKYFKANLLSNEGIKAIKYLEDRKISKDIINEFNIGLSTSNKLSNILSKKYSYDELVKLDICKDINGRYYDTFQDRIIFPIIDENNNVIAFSGRKYTNEDLNNNTLPKYSNTKETDIFKKSEVFYNINNAINEIKKKREIVITEGFMDTIRMSSIGYKNVVAIMGTAFTEKHLEKIKKWKCKVILNLDQDDAGVKGTIEAGETLLKNNIDTEVIVFDDYKDSDEFIKNKGSEAFKIAYDNRVSFIDFKLKYLKRKRNMKDAVEKAKYIKEAVLALNDLDSQILIDLKIKDIAEEFGISESDIRNEIKLNKKMAIKNVEEPKKVTRYDKYDKSELRILYLMLNYEDVILYFENTLGYLIQDDRALLAYKIIEFRNDYGYYNYSDFVDYISDNEKLMNVLKEVMKYHNNEDYTMEELDDYINTIKMYSIKKRIDTLKIEMSETFDVNKKIEIAKKIENINKEVLKW